MLWGFILLIAAIAILKSVNYYGVPIRIQRVFSLYNLVHYF